ncbi:hypothetical protein GNF76_03900 [Pseudomonas sp. CCM 7893]|uniref:Type III secretion protein n=1 Tax=Pseudomonas spelaei TaxID=1055469 RepID=A0A6I3W7P8_9PSED|nr:hypothetical protein [Pseudomonas spelaei]MUF03463.1 hypothetical protein [Pseudomonas spelaei]
MRIQEDSHSVKSTPGGSNQKSGTLASPTEDVNFFTAEVMRTESQVTPLNKNTASAFNIFLDQSNRLAASRKHITNSLKAYSTNNDEKQKRNYARYLSENQLQTQFLVKTLNKATQLVEKISNLQ